jgi:7-carboxy-7-deazaguanine synthase
VNATVYVTETFVSIQGESTWAGLPCFFVRLSGCNLRCRYCDTRYAYEPGRETAVEELVAAFLESGAPLAEITGGEPLLQAAAPELARRLRVCGDKPVLVETNGSRDISVLPEGIVTVMDLKCPGSGEAAAMDLRNVDRLRPSDEVKFVIGDHADFEWARDLSARFALPERCRAVLFSPVHGVLAPATLAEWVLAERLPVRAQAPLHKVMGIK